MSTTTSGGGPSARPSARTTAPRPAGGARLVPLVLGVVVGLVAGGLVTAGVMTAVPDGGEDAPEPGSIEAVAAELAQGQAEEQAALAAELATAAEQAHESAAEVLRGMAEVVPPAGAGGDGSEEPAGATGATADPDAWTAELEAARAGLLATGQGSDDHGVTRAALVGSLDLLLVAGEDARGLDEVGAGQEEAARELERHRAAAVELWQAGAARLDSLVVATGGEHVHLFLAPDGDPASVPPEFRELHEDD